MKDETKSLFIYFATMAVVVVIIWMLFNKFAGSVQDYEIIEPEKGVKCIVVSRMASVAVSCFSIKE